MNRSFRRPPLFACGAFAIAADAFTRCDVTAGDLLITVVAKPALFAFRAMTVAGGAVVCGAVLAAGHLLIAVVAKLSLFAFRAMTVAGGAIVANAVLAAGAGLAGFTKVTWFAFQAFAVAAFAIVADAVFSAAAGLTGFARSIGTFRTCGIHDTAHGVSTCASLKSASCRVGNSLYLVFYPEQNIRCAVILHDRGVL